MKKFIISTFVGFFFISLCLLIVSIAETFPETPQGIVKQFCTIDATGAGLSTPRWNEISSLTTWEDAPGWDYAVVIKNFEVSTLSEKDASAEVQVKYNTIGELNQNSNNCFFLDNMYKIEIYSFKLTKINGFWKIKAPQLPPHIEISVAIEEVKNKINTKKCTKENSNELLKLLNYYNR